MIRSARSGKRSWDAASVTGKPCGAWEFQESDAEDESIVDEEEGMR